MQSASAAWIKAHYPPRLHSWKWFPVSKTKLTHLLRPQVTPTSLLFDSKAFIFELANTAIACLAKCWDFSLRLTSKVCHQPPAVLPNSGIVIQVRSAHTPPQTEPAKPPHCRFTGLPHAEPTCCAHGCAPIQWGNFPFHPARTVEKTPVFHASTTTFTSHQGPTVQRGTAALRAKTESAAVAASPWIFWLYRRFAKLLNWCQSSTVNSDFLVCWMHCMSRQAAADASFG